MQEPNAPLVAERSIAASIILSIVTCGIYSYYWLYCIAKDSNELSRRHGDADKTTEAGTVVLLSIITCGIYLFYYIYKVSKQLAGLRFTDGYKPEDNSVICLLLSIFGLSLVAFAITQNTINDTLKHGN